MGCRVLCIAHFGFHCVSTLVIVRMKNIMEEFGFFEKLTLAIKAVLLRYIKGHIRGEVNENIHDTRTIQEFSKAGLTY